MAQVVEAQEGQAPLAGIGFQRRRLGAGHVGHEAAAEEAQAGRRRDRRPASRDRRGGCRRGRRRSWARVCSWPAILAPAWLLDRSHFPSRVRPFEDGPFPVTRTKAQKQTPMVAITLPDGSVRDFDGPVTGLEIAQSIGPRLAKDALAIKANGALLDLAREIAEDATVEIVTRGHDDAMELLRHDCAHVLAEAVQELYPGTQVTFGPAIENGFYYDFAREVPFTPEDLERIEVRMREIVERDEEITREVWDRGASDRVLRRGGGGLQGRAHRDPARGRGHHGLPPGRLARPLRRPAPAVHWQARPGLQAHQGLRRLLAGRRQERPAAARLRHLLGKREAADPLPHHAGGGGKARPSAPRP